MPGIMCELSYSRKGLVRHGGGWLTDQTLRAKIPANPPGFQPIVGPYAVIAVEASKRNTIQERAGVIDYLYHPEPKKEAK